MNQPKDKGANPAASRLAWKHWGWLVLLLVGAGLITIFFVNRSPLSSTTTAQPLPAPISNSSALGRSEAKVAIETAAAPITTASKVTLAWPVPVFTGCDKKAIDARMMRDEHPDDDKPVLEKTTKTGIQIHEQIVKQLISSTDTKERAAGLFLDMLEMSPDRKACAGEECPDSWRDHLQSRAKPTAQLATLAQGTNSPAIYLWALNACRGILHPEDIPAACGGVSAKQWAEMIQNNVWPWMRVAEEARQQGDISGEESAMYRASQATDWTHPGNEISYILVSKLPRSLGNAEFAQATSSLNRATGDISAVGVLGQYCDMNLGINKQPICAKLATGLIKHATELHDLEAAVKAATNAGVAADIVAPAAAEHAALWKFVLGEDEKKQAQEKYKTMYDANPQVALRYLADEQCASNELAGKHVLRRLQVGELQMLRELFKEFKP